MSRLVPPCLACSFSSLLVRPVFLPLLLSTICCLRMYYPLISCSSFAAFLATCRLPPSLLSPGQSGGPTPPPAVVPPMLRQSRSLSSPFRDPCHRVREARCLDVNATRTQLTNSFSFAIRFYDPEGGKILLGGRDLSTYSPGDISNIVSWVTQEPQLFPISGAFVWHRQLLLRPLVSLPVL